MGSYRLIIESKTNELKLLLMVFKPCTIYLSHFIEIEIFIESNIAYRLLYHYYSDTTFINLKFRRNYFS